MAARTRRIAVDDNTRAKIQTTQIAKRLMDHILGNIELSATQVTAALGLLKKTLPDLQSLEVDQTINDERSVINAKPVSENEWETEYSLESPERPTKSIN